MDLIAKIKSCCDYRSLCKLQKDLNENGLTVESLNSGQHILCRVEGGKPKADELFIDFIYLERRSLLEDINNTKRDVIVDFVERNISNNLKSDDAPSYQIQHNLYGKAYGV